ncbi:ribonuclease H2 subunit C [Cuculus canorus]|uniref:ribonuclease H2 subunit C n=1 Tax=Cuculus canorus TaxID=55661 RepID=UPI0023AB4FE8|nr:ribonuclease H2 subunit C [Cuculus canorus]
MAVRLRRRSAGPVGPVQLLPCRVRSDGDAPVRAFLRAREGPQGDLWASFRGRRLGGRELPLPHGFRGAVLREEEPPHGDPEERWLTETGTFGAVTEWGADAVPPPAMGLARALQWGSLAQALHAAVPEDDEDDELKP